MSDFVQLKNYAASSLAVALGAADTELQVLSADADKFPALAYPGDCFTGWLVGSDGNYEYVLATGRDGARITVERGMEGTAAREFPAGSRFELRMTALAWKTMAGNRWARPEDESGNVLLPTRVDGARFTVTGDLTALFQANRAVHLLQTAEAWGFVLSSSYAGGQTTVTVQNCAVDTGLSYVEVGMDPAAAPKYGEASRADDADLHAGQTVAEVRSGLALTVHSHTRAQITDIGTAAGYAVGTEQNTIPVLGSGGKIDASMLDIGSAANQIVALDAAGKLPALDGSQLTGVSSGEWKYVDKVEASGVSSVDYTNFNGEYDYKFVLRGCIPSSNGVSLWLRCGYTFSGAWNWQTDSYSWGSVVNDWGDVIRSANGTGQSHIQLSGTIYNGDYKLNGEVLLIGNMLSGQNHHYSMLSNMVYIGSTNLKGVHVIASSEFTLFDWFPWGVRLMMSSGNMTGVVERWRRTRQ